MRDDHPPHQAGFDKSSIKKLEGQLDEGRNANTIFEAAVVNTDGVKNMMQDLYMTKLTGTLVRLISKSGNKDEHDVRSQIRGDIQELIKRIEGITDGTGTEVRYDTYLPLGLRAEVSSWIAMKRKR